MGRARDAAAGASTRLALAARAADLAIEVARRDAADDTAPVPPAVLRPILSWRRGTSAATARAAALAALEDDAFRARVAASAVLDTLDDASRLVLERPAGWEDSLAIIETEVLQHDARAELLAVRDELAATRDQAARSAADAVDLQREVDRTKRQLEDLRIEHAALRDELATAVAMTEALADERQRAVRDLKRVEKLLATRTEELRVLQTAAPRDDAAAATGGPDVAAAQLDQWVDRARAVQSEMQARHAALGALIADLPASLTGSETTDDSTAGSTATAPNGESNDAAQRRSRSTGRQPIRFARGLTADTVEGVRWLLGQPGVHALIDGYNVTMTAWPSLSGAEQRNRIEAACAALASAAGAALTIVFDGDGSGGRPRRATGSAVRVLFTPDGVEADDVLLAMIPSLPIAQTVVVVSSDRRVVDGASSLGAIAVSSAVFAEVLRG